MGPLSSRTSMAHSQGTNKVQTASRPTLAHLFFSLEVSVFDLFDKLLSRCIRTMYNGPQAFPSPLLPLSLLFSSLLFCLSPLAGNGVCAGDRIGSASWEKGKRKGKIE
jgi:hypothetical protein